MGVDTVTQGPPPASQVVGAQGLILDRVNNHLYSFGQDAVAKLLAKTVAELVPQTALTAITTAQAFITQKFNAGELNVVGRTLRIKGSFIYSTTVSNVATISIAVVLGGVTLLTITTAATNTAASTNLPVQFEIILVVTATGASGTLFASGSVDADIGTAAAAAIARYLGTNTAVSSAVNLLVADTMTATIAGSAAIPSAQLLQATIELLA